MPDFSFFSVELSFSCLCLFLCVSGGLIKPYTRFFHNKSVHFWLLVRVDVLKNSFAGQVLQPSYASFLVWGVK